MSDQLHERVDVFKIQPTKTRICKTKPDYLNSGYH